MSAEKSPDLQLADSTVVKIHSLGSNNFVMITFSYDNNRSKVTFWSVDTQKQSLIIFRLRLTLKRNWSIRSSCMARDGLPATPMDP